MQAALGEDPMRNPFVTATRIGFLARGVMYLLVAYLALEFGRAADGSEALRYLDGGPGRILLAGIAVGFLAYGAWRALDAAVDGECHGTTAKGVAKRLGGAVSGLIHIGLGVYAARLALGGGADGGDGTRQGAAAALGMPGGEVLLGAAAVALVAAGLHQFVGAAKLRFLRHLDPGVAGRAWIAWAGRAGYAARGVVFTLIGIFLFRALLEGSAAEAGGMGEALASLPRALQTLVAVGLLLFGLFSLVEARWRRIGNPRLLGRLER
jgi:hypothetical protein